MALSVSTRQTSAPPSFVAKKAKILAELSTPTDVYSDASPKGSVDAAIIPLINNLNNLENYVTTSSCAGRISVFLEGEKAKDGHVDEGATIDIEGAAAPKTTTAGVGGKGGGGRWLFVSHAPANLENAGSLVKLLGVNVEGTGQAENLEGKRLIRFKFEPMVCTYSQNCPRSISIVPLAVHLTCGRVKLTTMKILHVLTSSVTAANSLVKAGLTAGFRESGAINLISSSTSPATPMVAIRSMGMGFESIIGYLDDNGETRLIISESLLTTFFVTSNERFIENDRRRERFWSNLINELARENENSQGKVKKGADGGEWEDKEVRRERLRREGLERAKARAAAVDRSPIDT